MQPRRAVVEDDFKNGFAAAAKTLEAGRDNRAAGRGGFVLRQFGDLAEMPAVLVTPRPCRSKSSTVRMSSRASCTARSAPTPQSELTGLRNTGVASSPQAGAASGEVLDSGSDIARTIQTGARPLQLLNL